MIPRWRIPAFVLGIALAVAGSVRMTAQHPSASDTAPEGAAASPVDVPRVRIDAVVTDRRQLPILDLRPGDFELLDNGVARAIESVELRRSPGAAGDPFPIQSAADETRAARQPGTRVFAMFLDEFHVSPGESSERVRAAVTGFIDQQLQPGDLALVVKPLNALSSLRFTRDRVALRSAVETFQGRKGDFTPTTKFEEQYIGRAPAAVALARAQIATAVLRELILKFGELQADRPVFVIVSEGFPRVSGGRLSRNSEIQGVVRAASRFNVAMYTFNPEERQDLSPPDPSKNDTPAAMLQWLALQTGGRPSLDGRVIGDSFRRMTDDLAAYYVLTYQPDRADGGYHPVEVRTKRPGAQVRTALGYWSPLGIEWRTAATSRPLTPRRALRRSNVIDLWTGLSRETDGRATLTLTWEPRAAFARSAQIVQIKAQTPAGVKLFDGPIMPVGAGGAQPDRAAFDAPSGRVELDITILGLDGKVMDTDARDIDVPSIDAKKRGPLLLTPEIVRVHTVRELAAARTDRRSSPTPDRSFSRSDRLLIRAPTWDATGLDVDVTAYVLNRLGQPMRPIERTSVPGVAAFDLPLSWLAPGEYAITLTARNANGQAGERISFTVTR